ncbi:MAG: acylphosphatase [Desulfobacterales bacterium]|nr:acylphosphatase [Desulfobacterales bacterium]
METKSRRRVIIRGRVQGVFFRMETQRAADRHGVFGWVKNRADGAVEAVFEGDTDKVDAVIDWCRQGPRHADVKGVDIQEENYTGEFKEFNIAY